MSHTICNTKYPISNKIIQNICIEQKQYFPFPKYRSINVHKQSSLGLQLFKYESSSNIFRWRCRKASPLQR